jgi:uncharacterized protein (DUF4415 family)
MKKEDIRRASLEEIRAMHDRGELFHDPNAPEGEELGDEFWANAVLEPPRLAKSVHLRLDPEVFAYFYETSNGKGHLTRMQNVLKAYVKAHKAV